MGFFLRAWDGIKGAAKWLWSRPALLAGLVGAVVGGIFVMRSKKNQINNLKDAVEVQKARQQIARAEAKAEVLEASAAETGEEVEVLKREIVASKRRAVEIAEGPGTEGMNDEEIANLFSASGL